MMPVENPILLNIPEEFETQRLMLHSHRDEDVQITNTAVKESIAELSRWLPWAKEPQTMAQTLAFIRHSRADFILGKAFRYSVFEKGRGSFVANCGVHPRDWHVPSFEIGYWTRTSEAGKGYMTEAVRCLTDYFVREVGAKRMVIRCASENHASAAVAKKCGYVWEGTHHRLHRDNRGDLIDMLHFVYLPEA